jgi:hypothetical protein
MQHDDPVPQVVPQFKIYVANLNSKLIGPVGSPQAALAASLNIPALDLTTLGNIHAMLDYGVDTVEQIQQRTKDVNAFWRWFLRGPVDPLQPATQTFPQALAWGMSLPPVGGNAIGWVSKFVTRLKKQTNCTAQVRQDLNLDGSAVTPEDPQTWKPVLVCSFTAGHPVIEWGRKPGARLEIWRKKPNGAYELADVDDVPDWTDMSALPAGGVAELWTYKAIYRLNGVQVGMWSDECVVAVKG